MIWHIGNTTVRTPYRLREALIALLDSGLNGNLAQENESKFAKLLHDEEVLYLSRIDTGADFSDTGRKWRSALSQLGFITPQFTRRAESGKTDSKLLPYTIGIDGLSGKPYEITPLGHKLISSDVVAAQQECFLRSLFIYKIPSSIENRYKCKPFKPLCFVINILLELEKRELEPKISFVEFALYVQTNTEDDGVKKVVDSISNYRSERTSWEGEIRRYHKKLYTEISKASNIAYSTLSDYADLSFRYLKSTGLFKSSGRGIVISDTKRKIALLIANNEDVIADDHEYFSTLWNGAELPSDKPSLAKSIILDLKERVEDKEHPILSEEFDSPSDMAILRHRLEKIIFEQEEEAFANSQKDDIENILGWLEVLETKKSVTLDDGTLIKFPKGEAPAYLEWILWRSFLAIDSLCNKPWNSRRFSIDQDFLPINCAPGGGADLIFEFDHTVIVVEVTLTTSSRQEAAEGEPVRRHIAKYVEEYNSKEVFGLFIALNIDSNTANTFRLGDWYLKDDSKLALDIVPLKLEDFRKILTSGKEKLSTLPEIIRTLIIECRAKANQDAPIWKSSIEQIVERISSGI